MRLQPFPGFIEKLNNILRKFLAFYGLLVARTSQDVRELLKNLANFSKLLTLKHIKLKALKKCEREF